MTACQGPVGVVPRVPGGLAAALSSVSDPRHANGGHEGQCHQRDAECLLIPWLRYTCVCVCASRVF